MKKNIKVFAIGILALFLQFFMADYLKVEGNLANFLLPFALFCFIIWGMCKKTIWFLFAMGMSYDVINVSLFGFTAFALLGSVWISSKLLIFFSNKNFFSCLFVLFILTVFYQFIFYFANVLLISDSFFGTFGQMLSYFFWSLFSNLLIFTFLQFIFRLKLSFYEESR